MTARAPTGPPRVLMIYLEPAPYVVGLVRATRAAWGGSVDVVYTAETLTQAWGGWSPEPGDEILPSGRVAAARALWRRLNRHNHDLVHLAGWGHPLLLWSLFVALLRGLPLTVESDTHVVSAGGGWKDLVKGLVHPWLFGAPKLFLPGGSRQAAYLRRFGVPASRIRIAQMTTDVSAVAAHVESVGPKQRKAILKAFGVPQARARILYMGRLEPYKGVPDLLDAFARLRTASGEAQLLIAGSGSLEPLVRQAAATDDRISYLGHLTGTHVWDAYAVSDLLVLPSRQEGWGLVINEAMAAGLPVIATDQVGCVDDLVLPGVTGTIVPAGEPERLSLAINDLLADPVARSRMGAEGRTLIRGWTLDEAAARTTAAWREAAR